MADEMRSCPLKHGKSCVELVHIRTKDAMCLGCRRGGRKLGCKLVEQRFAAYELQMETIRFKCMVREQLHEGLSKRPLADHEHAHDRTTALHDSFFFCGADSAHTRNYGRLNYNRV